VISIRGPILFAAGLGAVLAAGWAGFPAVLYVQEPQPIQFNHRVHKDKASMACADCHALREDGSFAGVPRTESCAGCHASPMGTTANEKRFVERYVTPNREVEWRIYARQPINVRFSHIQHVKAGKLKCEQCHGEQGSTERLRNYEENRISGYSRDIWGHSMIRANLRPGDGMKMSDCESCHEGRGIEAGCLGCHK
jgi:hypothetical protein